MEQDIANIPFAKLKKNGDIVVLRHISFECSNCALCCEVNRIPVTDKDISRIHKSGIDIDQILEEISPVLIRSKNIRDKFVKAYIMRKKPFINDCVFLTEDKMCKIHQFKPLACRIYPFATRISEENEIVFQIHPHVVCSSIELDVSEDNSDSLRIAQYIISLFPME